MQVLHVLSPRFPALLLVALAIINSLIAPGCAVNEQGKGNKTVHAKTVHAVRIYEAGSGQHFRLIPTRSGDIDWVRLCAAVVEQGKKDASGPGKRVWEFLKKDARDVAQDQDKVKRVDAWIRMPQDGSLDREAILARRALESGLEEVLRRPDFYDEKAFDGVALDDESKQLLKRQKTLLMLESWVLNRRLLEASFPEAITKIQFSLEKATVPVRVVATKEPITLVLCSYESVLWKVQADKGAKIEKVIVGGYHMQDVIGTDAPVTYRVYERPECVDGESRLFAYKKYDGYTNMAAAVRELTGAGITTSQGRYSYDTGPPFVVGAKE